jgi:ABC-type transport system substrate-binding protein
MERARSARILNGAAGVGVESVHATGATLVIRLARRSPSFLVRLAQPEFCAVSEAMPDEIGDHPYPTAGRYRIRAVHGDRVVLQRNPYYRGGSPRGPRWIELHRYIDPGSVAAGRADWVEIDINYQEFATSPHRRIVPTDVVRMLELNSNPGQPFASVRLRRAVAMAVDREALAKAMFRRQGEPSDHLLHPSIPGRSRERVFPGAGSAAAIARARALVRAAAVRPLTLWFRGETERVQAGAVAAQLRRIGLDVRPKELPRATVCGLLPWDLRFGDWQPGAHDPIVLVDRFALPKPDGCTFRDPTPAFPGRWVRAARRADRMRGDARLVALGKLEVKVLREAAPVVPLYFRNRLALVAPHVGCFRPHRVYAVDLGALCRR